MIPVTKEGGGYLALSSLRFRLPKSRSKNFPQALAIAEREPGFRKDEDCYWIDFPADNGPGLGFKSLEDLAKDWKGAGYYVDESLVAREVWWKEAWVRLQRGTVFVVLDVETTGLSAKDRIVEIAASAVRGGETLRSFQTLLNPGVPIPPETSCIHGIIDEDVRTAPCFKDIAGDLIAFFDGACLVAHNLNFDLRMLRQEFQRIGYPMPETAGLCTMEACGRLYPDRKLKLAAIAKFLKLDQGQPHEAMDDVEVTSSILTHVLDRGERFEGDIVRWPAHEYGTGARMLKRTHGLKTRPIKRVSPKRSLQPGSEPAAVRPTLIQAQALTPAERAAQEEADRKTWNSCLNLVAMMIGFFAFGVLLLLVAIMK